MLFSEKEVLVDRTTLSTKITPSTFKRFALEYNTVLGDVGTVPTLSDTLGQLSRQLSEMVIDYHERPLV